ncbi:MAG: DUF1285 domain-containing protein [Alphaproteobacteria bacterium]|nr:DUF1285 domain-containing protein [Alphaproteobacteria bacterium]
MKNALVDSPAAEALCGDIDIRIDRNGKWFYHGSPITRKEMVCLFASVLSRRADGSYWLITPVESGRIQVEDVPFMAVEMFMCGSGREKVVSFRTNIDELVTLGPSNPLRVETDPKSGEPCPYVLVREGIEARLARPVYYELVAHGIEEKFGEERSYGIWSGGNFFPLGSLEETS